MKLKKQKSKDPPVKDPEETTAQENNTPESSEKYKYLIKDRTVRKHIKKRSVVVAMLIFLSITFVLGGAAYAMLSFLEYNNFRVLIDKEGMNILSLSNFSSFASPTEVLSLGGPRYMDNVTLMDIYYKLPEIEATEGTYGKNGEIDYLAATFFLKNVSGEDQIYRESIILDDITKNVDDAIRIMIIRNGVSTIYAKLSADGTPEEAVPGQDFTRSGRPGPKSEVWMTEPFLNDRYVFYNAGLTVKAGEVVKYTILVWLEGWDAECIDNRLGGTIKIELQFAQENG